MQNFKNKIIGGIIIFIALFIISFMGNKTDVYAADVDTETVTINSQIDLGDGCSISLHAVTHIEYAWDEGVYGWIEDVTVEEDGGIGSNTVYIDDFYMCDISDPGSSVFKLKYYFYGFESGRWYNTFTGYVYICVSCDEWGNLDYWVEYEEL